MAPPQLNRSVHFVTGTGSCTNDLSKDARCEVQAGRADLGICLIIIIIILSITMDHVV